MPITDTKIRNARPRDKDYKLYDGRGLYVLVHTNGSRYWRLKYSYVNKEKILALGVYPELKLADARERAQDCWRRVKTEQLCRLKIDQAFDCVAYYAAVDKSTGLQWF